MEQVREEKAMSASYRVVIVGGGVGGMELVVGLGKQRAAHPPLEVTLIDRSSVHYWKPMLHEFAAGTVSHEQDCIDFSVEAARHNFRFVQASLSGVDRAAKSIAVTTAGGAHQSIPYDALVVALGSRANDFGIAGVLEHCAFIDSLSDASAFRARFRDEFIAADREQRPLAIGIVGGGATGTQLAAELCHAIDETPSLGPAARARTLRMTLIETGPRILPAFPERVSTEARAQLEKLGVDVRCEAMVIGVDETGFALKDGTHIDAPLKVWAAGVRATDATNLFEDLDRGRGGQITVDAHLRTPKDPSIFAIGDCARNNEEPLPATAQVARQQGIYLAQNMERFAAGGPVDPFVYRDRGSVVAFANYNGWGMMPNAKSFGGGPLRGIGARLVHDILYRQHQGTVSGHARGVTAFLQGLFGKRDQHPL